MKVLIIEDEVVAAQRLQILLKEYDKQIDIKITNLELYNKCQLDPSNRYIIIGDLHCCVDEFKQILLNVGFNIINNKNINSNKTPLNMGFYFIYKLNLFLIITYYHYQYIFYLLI